MANYRFLVNFEAVSGLPEDRVVNVLHAICDDDLAATGWATDLTLFYGQVHTGQSSGITEYYGRSIVRGSGVHSVRVYDLADPEPRVPVAEVAMAALTPNVNDALPREVALTLSFQGEPVSGGNQARRRGRIFLGPFNSSVLGGEIPDADARPNELFRDDIQVAAEFLASSSAGQWAVKSTFSPVLIPVANGWIDNAFDTQRRRGAAATVRQTFTL